MNEAIHQFIGRPWRFWAFGPDAFDCWGLTVVAARVLYGIKLPDIPVNLARWPGAPAVARAQLATGHWQRIETPHAGAVLALLNARNHLHHTSLMVGPDRVLHTTQARGSRIEPLRHVIATAHGWRLYAWHP